MHVKGYIDGPTHNHDNDISIVNHRHHFLEILLINKFVHDTLITPSSVGRGMIMSIYRVRCIPPGAAVAL